MKAKVKTEVLGSAFQQFPALTSMSGPHFEEFVQVCKLPDFRKSELRQATDRDESYRRWIFWTDLAEAKSLQADLHNFLPRGIPPEKENPQPINTGLLFPRTDGRLENSLAFAAGHEFPI